MPIELSPTKKIEGIHDPLIKQRYLKYFNLPQDVRQTIFAVETADKIKAVGEKNKLNQDQTWWASHTVGMILLGETNIVNFVKTLKSKCELSEEKARQLARDINRAVFLPVKESLKKFHKIDQWPREDESPQKKTKEPELRKELQDNIEELQKPQEKLKKQTQSAELSTNGNVVDLKNNEDNNINQNAV